MGNTLIGKAWTPSEYAEREAGVKEALLAIQSKRTIATIPLMFLEGLFHVHNNSLTATNLIPLCNGFLKLEQTGTISTTEHNTPNTISWLTHQLTHKVAVIASFQSPTLLHDTLWWKADQINDNIVCQADYIPCHIVWYFDDTQLKQRFSDIDINHQSLNWIQCLYAHVFGPRQLHHLTQLEKVDMYLTKHDDFFNNLLMINPNNEAVKDKLRRCMLNLRCVPVYFNQAFYMIMTFSLKTKKISNSDLVKGTLMEPRMRVTMKQMGHDKYIISV